MSRVWSCDEAPFLSGGRKRKVRRVRSLHLRPLWRCVGGIIVDEINENTMARLRIVAANNGLTMDELLVNLLDEIEDDTCPEL